MSTAQNIDPRTKMRARDVSKVTRGEQAPRPSGDHDSNVSRAPPPSSVKPRPKEEAEGSSADHTQFSDLMRNCCIRYYEYHRCIHEKGKDAPECEKYEKHYRALCPYEWIEMWDEEMSQGTFPTPI